MSVDERVTKPKRKSVIGIRRSTLALYDLGHLALDWKQLEAVKKSIRCVFYCNKHPGSRKGKPAVNVKHMIEKWVEAVVGLTLSHDKKSLDEWEFQLNDLLMPMLKCPVKQLREFYRGLVDALKNDKRIPFFVWRLFETWGKEILDNSPDDGVIKLKKEIAGRIASMVEPDVQPQLAEAIANALQWRDPKSLKGIEKSLKKGHKAKLVGKESCLFLEVNGETIML